uniref:uncharacterized protein LOC122591958 n=1 Tax=Erigeron canadensis TaxID=72917 RepID=UPI001CB89AF3|nr:uncharacterized protein LOC122591958 [Erigeron canadensis]
MGVGEPLGRSGGLVCVWDTRMFTKTSSVKDNNFLIIKGKLKGCDEAVFLANVYAPQKVRDKKRLWDRLVAAKNVERGLWIFMGDFNAVRSPEERKGSLFNSGCARAFNNFIYEADLHEYEMRGRKFMFLKYDNGRGKFSKIDRFLVGIEILEKWPLACCRVLSRAFSDHSPILLSFKDLNFGPKPFRVFNSWLDKSDFEEVVTKAWGEAISFGPADTRLMMKFKYLRDQIKVWRDEIREKEGEEMDKCRKELEEIERAMEENDLI